MQQSQSSLSSPSTSSLASPVSANSVKKRAPQTSASKTGVAESSLALPSLPSHSATIGAASAAIHGVVSSGPTTNTVVDSTKKKKMDPNDTDGNDEKKKQQATAMMLLPPPSWLPSCCHGIYRYMMRLVMDYGVAKVLCLAAFFVFKVVVALSVIHGMIMSAIGGYSSASSPGTNCSRPGTFPLSMSQQHAEATVTAPTRILYIVTSLAEFNNGRRETKAGQDRLGEVVLPMLADNVYSMVANPAFQYHVDVYLILAYKLLPHRFQEIRSRLPLEVGLDVWDEACPLGYESNKPDGDKIVHQNTRALSRQHRYVVKDKLFDYDMFLAFEDDMRITGYHVQHHLALTAELDRLRAMAPETLPDIPEPMDVRSMKFFGDMTRDQLDRIMPGFIRVEVLLDSKSNGAQASDPIPSDFQYKIKFGGDDDETMDGSSVQEKELHFDPYYCCHIHMIPNVENLPTQPNSTDVVVWETGIVAMMVRRMPTLRNYMNKNGIPIGSTSTSLMNWVALLPGPGKRLSQEKSIGGYWSGRSGAYGVNATKPSGGEPKLIAQQGGWMATREQILRLNHKLCMGSFLPPFDTPMYRDDGQESNNVEFWSGGYQFFTGVTGGCNVQRIASLHPQHFSKHFIYHVANNKQKQLSADRMVRAYDLMGQLNTIKKQAEAEWRANRTAEAAATSSLW